MATTSNYLYTEESVSQLLPGASIPGSPIYLAVDSISKEERGLTITPLWTSHGIFAPAILMAEQVSATFSVLLMPICEFTDRAFSRSRWSFFGSFLCCRQFIWDQRVVAPLLELVDMAWAPHSGKDLSATPHGVYC
jgi:hypothetical protein